MIRKPIHVPSTIRMLNIGNIVTLSLLLQSGIYLHSQDTFSIVAIDSITGEIGSAGASCVGSSGIYPYGAKILSDVIPGIGVIHTQAAWNPNNQQYAHDLMMQGLSPQQIIDSLVANDAQNNPTNRQYGIVDFNGGHPRSASYTGVNCLDYKNDTSHLEYSIQGNILMGPEILDSMQSRFLNTEGTLADRLMAALQGAKVVGADTRCADNNASSQSAFLRVAQMDDDPDYLYLDLHMAYPQSMGGIYPVDPIDSLQMLYDEWKLYLSAGDSPGKYNPFLKVFTDKSGTTIFDFTFCRDYAGSRVEIYDITGRKVAGFEVDSSIERIRLQVKGMLIYRVLDKNHRQLAKGKHIVPGND